MPGQRVATHSGGRPTDLATPSLMEPQPAVEPHPLALQLSHVVDAAAQLRVAKDRLPLPAAMRARMESAFSADFSAVRVHDDSAAQARATELGTDAFTEGPDVYLGAGTSVADQRLLAHELAHVYQGAGNSAPATGISAPNSAVEREAASAAARVVAGGSAGSLRPSHAAVMRDDAAGGPVTLHISGQSIQVPGRSGHYAVFPGAPFDPGALVILLRDALEARRQVRRAMAWSPVLAVAIQLASDKLALDVPAILRLGDRATWVQARALFETQTGDLLLRRLQDELSQKELSAALPHLRGVVPAQDLIRVWSGTFSTDVPGILRVLDRIPDTEALALVAEYRSLHGFSGTAAAALASSVASELKGEQGAAYTALRTLASGSSA